MKNMIIGTAGHVDHGKTAIIRALTGIECDRLEEEKKRGITIDLGFAHMDIPLFGSSDSETCSKMRSIEETTDCIQVGIVDVPGHEKFVRNMLSGASGMDMVLLVVDINEGVMPQTREHLDILSILGVKKGILVLNKIDLMDEADIPLAKEKVFCELKGTFLENAPVALVSAKSGSGIEELKELICKELICSESMLSDSCSSSDKTGEPKSVDSSSQPFFLPIDRAFNVKGFGTVVTGTIKSGEVELSGEYTLYPEGKRIQARSIQVHSKDVERASEGQRVAISLKDISKERELSKEGLQRGHFLTAKDAFTPTMMLDVKLTLLKDSPFGVKNGALVHFYYGTGEYLAKVVLMDRDYLDAGESTYAQLRFKEELIGRVNDPFVIRFLSPQLTIGGGVILDATPVKKKRNKDTVLEGFQIKESGSLEDRIYEYIREHNNTFINIRDLLTISNNSPDAVSRTGTSNSPAFESAALPPALDSLVESNRVVILDQKKVITSEQLERLKTHLGRILSDYHQRNVTMVGMPLAEAKERLLGSKREKDAKALINFFITEGFIKEEANCISLYHFQHRVLKEDEEVRTRLINIYETAFINPPSYNDMKVGFIGAKGFLSVLKSLVKDGILIKLDERYYIHKDAYAFAYEKLLLMAPHLENGEFTLGEYRDRLKCSRKVALAILEHFDKEGITLREREFRRVFLD